MSDIDKALGLALPDVSDETQGEQAGDADRLNRLHGTDQLAALIEAGQVSAGDVQHSAAGSALTAALGAVEGGTVVTATAVSSAMGTFSADGAISNDVKIDTTVVTSSVDGRADNGSGALATTVAASGNALIAGILSGSKWAGTSISYSDPTSTSQYQAGYPEALTNFQHINADQLTTAHFALSTLYDPFGAEGFAVEGFTNLGISYVGANGNGTIRLANTDDPSTAYAYYPNSGVTGGDAFFGGSGRTPVTGNYHWHTILHELGHSLGLKHGQENTGFGALPYDYDSMEYTIMTYRSYVGQPISGYTNEEFGYAQTYMMLDIAALQYLYGADFTTNSGNTTYKWNPTSGDTLVNGYVGIHPGGNRIFATIWDGGGIDTYDLSSYTTNLKIDLTPGGYSVFSSTQLADLDQFSSDPARIARGNIFNALQYQGDARSLIENAIGGSGDDSILGNAADNVLTGNAGNDTLSGGDGNDTLYGGIGDDSLIGGTGLDYMDGSDGNDTFVGGTYVDTVYGGNGDDKLVITGGDFIDDYYGGSGTDTLDLSGFNAVGVSIDLGAGTWVTTAGFEGTRSISSVEIIYGTTQADTIIGSGSLETFYGGDGNDSLHGSYSTDTIYGGNGDDTISATGYEFIDDVYGGAGTDTLDLTGQGGSVGTAGAIIDLGAGTYSLTDGYGGTHTIDSIEVVIGTSQADTITSSVAGVAETFYGGDGNDSLQGGWAVDTIYGGGGDDTISVSSYEYIDDVYGGSGTDTLDLSALTGYGANPVVVDLGAGTWSVSGGLEGSHVVDSIETVIGTAQGDTITSSVSAFETFYGGDGNDLLQAGYTTDTVYGGNGDDTIRVLDGEYYDNAYGGAGTDTLDHSASTYSGSTFDFSTGTITSGYVNSGTAAIDSIEVYLDGSGANTIVSSGMSGVQLYGGGGNDTMIAVAGFDSLYGGDGIDTLDLSRGNFAYTFDTATGKSVEYGSFEDFAGFEHFIFGDANDTITTNQSLGHQETIEAGGGDDTVIDGGGADNLAGGAGIDTLSYANSIGGVTVKLWNNTATGGDATGDVISGFENVLGGAGDDSLSGNGAANRLEGGAGNDTIEGGGGADTLNGGTGVNTLAYYGDTVGVTINLATNTASGGVAAGDVISNFQNVTGGSGNDNLTGDTNANILFGAWGNDTITGGDGNDTIEGGAGADILYGGAGIDTLSYTNSGAVTVTLWNNTATGSLATGDVISGFENVLGGAGDDNFSGNGAANRLEGAGGNDTIEGGGGADTLDGGAGVNTLGYFGDTVGVTINLATNSASGGAAAGDVISNFQNVTGGSGNDNLTGDANANILRGASGNDTITGGAGNDTIEGGRGSDVLAGGTGIDTLSYASSAGVIVKLWNNTATGSEANGDVISGFENVLGGNGNDNFSGNGGANRLEGGGGNDTIEGGGGADTLDGGSGVNLLAYFGDTVGVTVNLATGTASGGVATGDVFSNFQNLAGGSGADKLTGDANANLITGGAGNDTINGGAGNDTLGGGAGADVFDFYNGSGADRINDFVLGVDKIQYHGHTSADVTLTTSGANVLVTLNTGDTILVMNHTVAQLSSFSDFIFA